MFKDNWQDQADKSTKTLVAGILCCLCIFLAPLSAAHEVRPAYLHIQQKSDTNGETYYEVLWKQPAVQNGRLAIQPVFAAGCELAEIATPEITASAYLQRWMTRCPLTQSTIHIDGLSKTLTDVMVRVDDADGESSNYLLRPENPTLDLSSSTPGSLSYFVIGIEHLIFGIDHVLFVVGLVLFIRNPWMLLKTITAFTIAHSITLAFSIFGWVQLDQRPVEAIIALSILFLARELVSDEQHRSRLTQASPWIMAFVFGLLHGLGFAGALRDVGLPDDTLWLALLLFNVGIEVGQLMIIGAFAVVAWIARRFTQIDTLTRYGAYVMGCLAAFWTIDRTLLLL